MKKIIAVVGMCGAGKSEAVEFFQNLDYKLVYFGGITLEKLREENVEITPENEKSMREGLRAKYGMGAYAILSLSKIREYIKNDNVVIDGLYSWDELLILKEEFGDLVNVIAIIADKNIRYGRLSKRKIRALTKDEAIKRDVAEIENMAKGGPIAFADYYCFNDSTIEDLNKRLKEILEDIKKAND